MLPIAAPMGDLVTLGTVASAEVTSGPAQINHRERERTVTIAVTPPEDAPLQEAMEAIESTILEPLRDEGELGGLYRVRLSGTADKLTQTGRALIWNLVLALIITYLVMSALFESFAHPFVIMFSVPLAALGGFLGLAAMNLFSFPSMDILKMLGFIILIGTVVNNAVLMPDATILTVGGEKQYAQVGDCSEVPALVPELYSTKYNVWVELAPSTIIRDYHSCAILLPGGKILTGGGESAHYPPWPNCNVRVGRVATVFPADYQIFVPPYLSCGFPRPNLTSAPTAGTARTFLYGNQYRVKHDPLPKGEHIAKATLLWPAAMTHHADTNQRCVELDLVETDDGVMVTVPPKTSYMLPRGYYMLYLVTNRGAVSQVEGDPDGGYWVQVQ